MSDVFISYKAEDRRRIQPLVHALQADGLSVWWDEHIGAGDEWSETIERQLDSARAVVVVWSKRSIGPEGRFVREEARRAQRRGVYVPVLIDAVEPPLGFAENQATSLRGWRGARSDPHYQAVLAAVRRHVGGPGAPTASPQPAGIDRRVVIAGGAAAAIAASAVGAWVLFKPASASAFGSIAVLPFANLSGDPNQAYFSDGMAEELRDSLARLGGLKVIGRTSSEAVRNDDAETAARKLGVAAILTGSVRQSPSTIRVSAQLIDGRTGVERWSQDYDRSPGDTIKIQTDIAENVANALRIALGSAGRAALTVGGTSNVEAQRLLLEAGSLSTFSEPSLERALALVDQAIAIDANYAGAYVRKSGLLAWRARFFSHTNSGLDSDRSEAERYAKRALELAPGLPGAHLVMGNVQGSYLRFATAHDEYKRALALAPDDVDALNSYALFLASAGDEADALRMVDRAIGVDPLSAGARGRRFFILFLGRRYADALAERRSSLREWPEQADRPDPVVASAFILLGKNDEAEQSLKGMDPNSPFRMTLEAMILARKGDPAGAVALKNREKQLYGDTLNYEYAKIDAQLGDTEQAFADLDRAWRFKDPQLGFILVEPWLDPLRKDPRFAALVNKVNASGRG